MFDVLTAKENVKRALVINEDWRKEAHEDYAFVQGKQWSDVDKKTLKEANRPCITINRIRPVVNLLCGYAAQNETEPDFMPRSEEDDRISRVAKGITKYVLDRTNYQREKKKVFRDVVTCGLGAYWVSYDFDYAKMDGQVLIERMSPFDVFKDPESVREDLSDAMFCGRYTWESKEKLKQVYPDKAEEIERLYHKYDDTEQEVTNSYPQWYDKDLQKVRVVQYWYKEYTTKTIYVTSEGVVDENNPLYGLAKALGIKGQEIPDVKIRYATFADDVLLEDSDSPYSHGRFPLVFQFCYYSGENADDDRLEPAGVVRDIKDAQRELNKNRSQRMHIVNQQALGVRMWHGVQDERTKKTIRDNITKPGANIYLPPGVTYEEGLPANQSIGNMELENQANSDFYTISGITPESLSGSIGAMSGKAIDLRQSVTTVQTADIFDKAKESERQIVLILWGEKGKAGLIPQYYNEQKAMRILGDDGKAEFAHIEPNLNQAMVEQPQVDQFGQQQYDEDGNPVKKVLYDLSAFDFDITIVTSQASATARKASLYQLLEAKQSGADIPMEIIVKYMDFPDKDEMLRMLKERGSQPAQLDVRLSANVKDLPAEALSEYLQTIGVNISPQQILAERLAAQGGNDQLQVNSAMQAQQGFAQQQMQEQAKQQPQLQPQDMPPQM